MKKISYFLWVCVVGLLGYMTYFFLTTTRLREQDLAVVGQLNRDLKKLSQFTQLITKQSLKKGEVSVQKLGNIPKDVAYLQSAHTIQLLTKQCLENNYAAFKQKNAKKQEENYLAYCQKVSEVDTMLQDLGNVGKSFAFHSTLDVFQENYHLRFLRRIASVESKSIERLMARVGGVIICCWGCERWLVYPYNEIVAENTWYQAHILFVSSRYLPRSIKMIPTKGSIKVSGSEGEMSIPYQPVQFDKNGLSTQVAKAEIRFKKLDEIGVDTTIYLSTTYTVKRKK